MIPTIYKLLEGCLYFGMDEAAFWDMSLDEIQRFIDVGNKRKLDNYRTQASLIHRNAELIGRSVSRLISKNNNYPNLYEAFPGLFDEEKEQELLQDQRTKLSVHRFIAFAQQHNKKYNTKEHGE